jgi:hypothetical protein
MRNRRLHQRRGPLVVCNEDNGIVKAFRNLPGRQRKETQPLAARSRELEERILGPWQDV